MVCLNEETWGKGNIQVHVVEAVSSLQVCPVTVQISLSPCVGRTDALTPVLALLAVWGSKTISLSLDRASQRICVTLTPVQKTKGKSNGSLSFFEDEPLLSSSAVYQRVKIQRWLRRSLPWRVWCLEGKGHIQLLGNRLWLGNLEWSHWCSLGEAWSSL